MKTFTAPKQRLAGFTLVELLVVIAIIALLAGLTIGAFGYATAAAGRNRTEATMAAIKAGLEKYNADFGEFPEPSNPGGVEQINNVSYRVGGAEMLYQAMSGDGNNAIRLDSGGGRGSNGIIEDDEVRFMMMSDMPRDIWLQLNNRFFIIDGFRKPMQYTKGGTPNAVNPTYDLWSYGQDEQNTQVDSVAAKTNPNISRMWITNW